MARHPERDQDPDTPYYAHPTGGWGSIRSVAEVVLKGHVQPSVLNTLRRQNKPRGHMCTSCAWAKPKSPHLAEFCENGAKATGWDLTRDRCGPDFFADHTVSELQGWRDHDLEGTGRLTHPLRYDAASDRYVETSWDDAFAAIGANLRRLDPKSTVFYASGRASLETSYLYALFARAYGHNNLPDSSNMCHETTSVALKQKIGSPVGTCVLDDFEHCDMILFFGQNTGSNSPRFLHPIQAAAKRGCRIVTFNPVRERGLIEFTSPQSPQMLTGGSTKISDLYLQLKPGGDIAALTGLCKHALEMDAVDRDFVDQHCTGFDDFAQRMRDTTWDEIERISGLSRDELVEVAEAFAKSKRCIGVYGMGLTQHVHGSQSVGMLVNLLLMGGHMGREGAGICPVRGHSNVQGQRTVGISEKPELVPMDRLADLFDFQPPRDTGLTTIEAVQGVIDGSVRGFVSLGGNFARAIPDQDRSDPAWAGLELNVQIATRLNRSHTLVGDGAWLLPCLVRAERDQQDSGPQSVTIEDSLSHIHGSVGKVTPASKHLRSELAIIAGLAKATLQPHPRMPWDAWCANYDSVRDLIEATYPDQFADFNARMFDAGGFYRGNSARDRDWKTESGRAEFTTPTTMTALEAETGGDVHTLITLRSNGQFNTTIYSYVDRLRNLENDRMVVLMSPSEIARAGLSEGAQVTLHSTVEDGTSRKLAGLRVVAYDLPDGCVAAYYPEANGLVPLSSHDKASKTPAYKGVPVRIEAMA